MRTSHAIMLTVLFLALVLGGCTPLPALPAEIIIDNRDPGARVVSGEWGSASADTGNGAWGEDFLYHTADRENIGIVRFTPEIERGGKYTVYIYWSAESDRTTDQPVVVHAADGDETYHVNLQQYGHQWYKLGVHRFDAGTGGYIEFNTNTDSGYCNADAVRLVAD